MQPIACSQLCLLGALHCSSGTAYVAPGGSPSSINGPPLLCRPCRLPVACSQHSHGNQATSVAMLSSAGIYLSPGSGGSVLIIITNREFNYWEFDNFLRMFKNWDNIKCVHT